MRRRAFLMDGSDSYDAAQAGSMVGAAWARMRGRPHRRQRARPHRRSVDAVGPGRGGLRRPYRAASEQRRRCQGHRPTQDAGDRRWRPAGPARLQRRARAPDQRRRRARRRRPAPGDERGRTSRAGSRDMRHAAEGPLDPRRLLGSRGLAEQGAADARSSSTPSRPTTRSSFSGSTATWGSPTRSPCGSPASRATRASPDGGTIVRDAQGEPTGILKDNAMDLITRAVPPDTLEQTIDKARAALQHAASRRRHDDAGHDGKRRRAARLSGACARRAS